MMIGCVGDWSLNIKVFDHDNRSRRRGDPSFRGCSAAGGGWAKCAGEAGCQRLNGQINIVTRLITHNF